VRLSIFVLQASACDDPLAGSLVLAERLERLPGRETALRAEGSLGIANGTRLDLGAGFPAQRAVGMPPGGAHRCRRRACRGPQTVRPRHKLSGGNVPTLSSVGLVSTPAFSAAATRFFSCLCSRRSRSVCSRARFA
jgi:hypothetical protein